MKAIALVALLTSCGCCAAELGKNEIAGAKSTEVTKLGPLPLKLPAPSLGANGPLDLPVGPHIEPFSQQLRPPLLTPLGVTNIAFGKKVTGSVANPVRGKFSMITDGSKEAFSFDLAEITNGVQWVQIDLEREYRIYAIVLWHDYYRQFPVFRSVIVQVADDAAFTTSVRTLFNNDYENLAGLGPGVDKQYFEDHQGKLIAPKGIKARHLRAYSNGSNKSPLNGYVEIEVWGF